MTPRHFHGGPLDGKTFDIPAHYLTWHVAMNHTPYELPWSFPPTTDDKQPFDLYTYELKQFTDGRLEFFPKNPHA